MPLHPACFIASSFAICLLAACAGSAPDPYAGYYSGRDKVVRILASGSFAYEVRILPKAGDTAMVRANLYEGKLTSEYGGGFTLTQETADEYSMGVPPKSETLRRIDSAAFAQWVTATRPDLAPSDSIAAPEEEAPADDVPKSKSRFR